ncbi:MAG: hypothetical protein Q8N05_20475 [Bacteroidota bacterium]|nr:hypothetical protein [Bacteroidota bacterium]
MEINDPKLKKKYSSFLELFKRNTGKELNAVKTTQYIIGNVSPNNKKWGQQISVYIGHEYNGTDSIIRGVIKEINTGLGFEYLKETSTSTTNGWNFDLSKVDYRESRRLSSMVDFYDNRNPKSCTFFVEGIFYYPNDLKTRLRHEITKNLLFYSNFDKDLLYTGTYDQQYFKITQFKPDLLNILRIIISLNKDHNFANDLNELHEFPVADAGATQINRKVGEVIQLDATQSIAPNGVITSYTWRQIFNTKTGENFITSNTVSLSESTSPLASFVPQWPGNYRFELVVVDDEGFTNKDSVDIEVSLSANPLKIRWLNCWGYYEPNGLEDYVAKMTDEYVNYDHTEWIEFAPFWWMENKRSTDIHPLPEWVSGSPGFTIPDSTLIKLISIFHAKGLKVMLRPTLEFYNWSEWRGGLQPGNWDAWFASYQNFILHYAKIAEQTGVELFSVGNELKNSNSYTDKWTGIISEVRKTYRGLLTYSDSDLPYGISPIEFWDKLDIIGTGFYSPITGAGSYWDTGFPAMKDPPFDIFVQPMQNWFNKFLLPIHNKYQKQVLITEAGCSNVDGANLAPWVWDYSNTTLDNKEQADYYEAFLRVISDKSWISGVFFFEYDLMRDYSFQRSIWPIAHNPKNKPAREVVRLWYTK